MQVAALAPTPDVTRPDSALRTTFAVLSWQEHGVRHDASSVSLGF